MTQIGFEELSADVKQHLLQMSAKMMTLEHAFVCLAKRVAAGASDQEILDFTNEVQESVLAATVGHRASGPATEIAVQQSIENLVQSVLAVTGVAARRSVQ